MNITQNHISLEENNSLLNVMVEDMFNQPSIYKPGPFWINKSKNALREIKRAGINNFRGSDNMVGMSFTDSFYLDARYMYNDSLSHKIIKKIVDSFPLKNIFNTQVSWTKYYAELSAQRAGDALKQSPKFKELIERYKIENSTIGGCLNKIEVDGKEYALHYIDLLDQHHEISKYIDFSKVKTIFEIGGGFGTNIHLLLENYNNIKKVIYLDIPPNLYIGTQYLKALYGENVIDYNLLRNKDKIKFSNNDDLEILCIAPWQIENLDCEIDFFTNMHSFVEMSEDIVKNYIKHLEKLTMSGKTSIALVSYDKFDSHTIHPDKLQTYFANRQFKRTEVKTLLNSNRQNFFYISNAQ